MAARVFLKTSLTAAITSEKGRKQNGEKYIVISVFKNRPKQMVVIKISLYMIKINSYCYRFL